jgi:hypothetical protein
MVHMNEHIKLGLIQFTLGLCLVYKTYVILV